ncbi:MAG: YkgJ family cysteine cluster protein [Sulfuricella sp.]
MLSSEEQADFLSALAAVERVALNQLSANRELPFAIAFIAKLQHGVDQVVHAAMDQGEKLDCRAGCSHCCNFRVEALEPEIFRIARELKKLSPEKLAELVGRLQSHAAMAKGVSVWDYRIACPFLAENLCSIYPVRPAVCRKAHSFEVGKCEIAGAEIPQSLNIVLRTEALMKGTANAYGKVGLPASGHELGQAVLFALTDETAESRWHEGRAVFDEVC